MRQQLSLNPDPFLLVFVSDIVPVGIIAGGTVGSSILLLMFLLALAFFLYRQRKGSECTRWSSNLCVCVGPCTLTYCLCLSFFILATLPICRSASPYLKKGTHGTRIAFYSNEINEYSYNMANCLKTPTLRFPFHSTDMELYYNKLYFFATRTLDRVHI